MKKILLAFFILYANIQVAQAQINFAPTVDYSTGDEAQVVAIADLMEIVKSVWRLPS